VRLIVAVHLIIDGYNLIHALSFLQSCAMESLETAREELIRMLMRYKRRKKHEITLVFDGSGKGHGSESGSVHGGVRVVFSAGNRQADDLIRELAARHREKAVVVSSDRAVADAAIGYGAVSLPVERFLVYLEADGDRLKKADSSDEEASDRPGTGARKKGPAARPSKKERRQRSRIAKL